MIIISNTKYYRNSCSHLSLNHRSHWVKSKRKCQKKTRGDCLGLFVLAPPNALARFWTLNQTTNFEPCARIQQRHPEINKFAAIASN